MLDEILFCGKTGRGTGAEVVIDSTCLRSDVYNGRSDNASAGRVRVLMEVGELEITVLT